MTFSAEFVETLRRGDPAAFVTLIERTTPAVRMIVRKYHFSLFDQEEAMQEVWLTIYRRRETLSPDLADKVIGWVSTVARNKAIDVARARGRRPETLTDTLPDTLAEAAVGQTVVQERELRAAVDQFASSLKPDWQDFFRLHFVDGLGYPEVSRKLGITRLRCRYMKRVIAAQARDDAALLDALGRGGEPKGQSDHAS